MGHHLVQFSHGFVFIKLMANPMGNPIYIPLWMVNSHYTILIGIPSGKRLHNYGLNHYAITGNIHYFYGNVHDDGGT